MAGVPRALESSSISRAREIDRLRALAIIFVVFHHWGFAQSAFGLAWLGSGWSGVDLFFVISGYVVTLSLLRNISTSGGSFNEKESNIFDRIRKWQYGVMAFYIRRLLRIVPAAAFWVGVPIFCQVFFNQSQAFNGPSDHFPEIASLLSLTYNYWVIGKPSLFHFYWSLMVEEHFYLILPWIFILLANNRQRLCAVLGIIVLIAFVVRPFYASETLTGNWLAVRFHSHLRFDSLFTGVVLALLSVEKALPRLPSQLSFRLFVLTLMGIALWLMILIPYKLSIDYSHGAGFVAFSVLSAGLVFLAIQGKGYIFELPLLGTLLTYIGTRSFGIYLSHSWSDLIFRELTHRWPVLTTQFDTLSPEWLHVIAASIICLLAAETTHQLVERPSIYLGGRLAEMVLAERYGHKLMRVQEVERKKAA